MLEAGARSREAALFLGQLILQLQNDALSNLLADTLSRRQRLLVLRHDGQGQILELKDKLAKEQSSFTVPSGGGSAPMPLGGSKSGEAAAALAVLGYGSQEISTALKGIDMDALPLEEIIRQALKKMVK